jgi:hypothetical protein
MRPRAGEVLHFSEDPMITRFVPHVAATAQRPEAFVWAVGDSSAPSYWVPRDCPRVMAWVTSATTTADRERVLGPGGGSRVHAVEYAWLERIASVELYAYRFSADAFEPLHDDPSSGQPPYAFVSTRAVEPIAPPEPVGSVLRLHEQAGIQLRVLDNLWLFWDFVRASTLGHSGIRLANAAARPVAIHPAGSNPTEGAT